MPRIVRIVERKKGMLDEIRSVIHLEGNLDETQHRRLLEIATRCPVHRTLSSEIKICTTET
jgi:putative redox protein